MMQRSLSGPIRAQELGGGSWQLTAGVPPAAQVYLRIPSDTNCAVLKASDIQRLDVQWHDDGVTVRVAHAGGSGRLEAATVIIHEAKISLYDGLPLARFDAKARQFWQRVFWLIRLPGGRYLLRLIARRRR